MQVHGLVDVSISFQESDGVYALAGLVHGSFEELIDLVELQAFLNQIASDIWSCEYIFQVDPLVLQLHPGVHNILQF